MNKKKLQEHKARKETLAHVREKLEKKKMKLAMDDHRKKMERICLEILNVCWCHGCGREKLFSSNYVGSFCSKRCWKGVYRNFRGDDSSWCMLGDKCLECRGNRVYTLRQANHIQRYYNRDPMGAKDMKYTKNAKPKINIYPHREKWILVCHGDG